MIYRNVCLESLGYTLPDEIVTSDEIEARLEPLYSRLRLPEGRLELMTGIRERRFWEPGTLPSQISVQSAEKAIAASGIAPDRIGAIVHASVCRDYLEPATSCVVHDRLGLPSDCVVYDCSNACLGFLNGMIQVANMIELGQIEAGVVVASEGSRELVETTIERLNSDESLTRDSVKPAMASLTIGSASAAAVLTDRRISRTDNRLLGAVARADTSAVGLCQSGRDESVGGQMKPLMNTDAEQLMAAGVALAALTFGQFTDELAFSVDDINRTCCHQVGAMHRRLMLETLGLNPENDFTTFELLGNTGSAAMPVTAALAAERGFIREKDQVAMLGIGSGLNSVMIAVDWQTVASASEKSVPTALPQATVG